MAPRLRATGLPCIASPEIKSSGNTQQLGTENNRFIDLLAETYVYILHDERGQAAHMVRLHLCTLFSRHGRGLDDKGTTTTRQRNDEVVELHSTGTLLGHDLEHDKLLNVKSLHGFSCIWHDKPGEYFECTRKLTTNKTSATNNNRAFNKLNA